MGKWMKSHANDVAGSYRPRNLFTKLDFQNLVVAPF